MVDLTRPEDRLDALLAPLPDAAVGPVTAPPFADLHRRGVRRRRARVAGTTAAAAVAVGGLVLGTALLGPLLGDDPAPEPAGPVTPAGVPDDARQLLRSGASSLAAVHAGDDGAVAAVWDGPGAWVVAVDDGRGGVSAVVRDGEEPGELVTVPGGWLVASDDASPQLLGPDGRLTDVAVAAEPSAPRPGDVAWVPEVVDAGAGLWLWRPDEATLHPGPVLGRSNEAVAPALRAPVPVDAAVSDAGRLAVVVQFGAQADGWDVSLDVHDDDSWSRSPLAEGIGSTARVSTTGGTLVVGVGQADEVDGLVRVDGRTGTATEVDLALGGPLPGHLVAVDDDGTSLVVDGLDGTLLRVSPDGGTAVVPGTPMLRGDLTAADGRVVAQDREDPELLWTSTDGGTTWFPSGVPGSAV